MKKTILFILMIVIMSNVVFSQDATGSRSGNIAYQTANPTTFWDKILNSIIGFHSVEISGKTYDCSKDIDEELYVNGNKNWVSTTGKVCYTNSHSFPVTMQIFTPSGSRWAQVGSDVDIQPGTKGCNYNLIVGKTYGGSIYYCNIPKDYSANCVDVDGGIDYYEYGITSLREGTAKEDSCNEDKLIEYFCSEDLKSIQSQTVTCPYGCDNGRCLKKGEQSNGEVKTVPPSETPSLRECTDFKKVLEKKAINPLEVSSLKGTTAHIKLCIENTGADMTSPWILEIQPQASGVPVQSIFGFQEERRPCNASIKENQNKAFQLKKGERVELEFEIDVPEEKITAITRNTFFYAIITEYCGCTSEECYKSPYKAGYYLGNIAFGEYQTCASLNGTCKKIIEGQTSNLCGENYKRLTNSFECSSIEVCCVPLRINETGCVPTQIYEDLKNEEVSEADMKESSAKSKDDCCSVEEKDRRLSFFTQNKFQSEFDYTMPTGFWNGLVQKFGVSEVGICVNYPTSKDVSGDSCSWTTWAPDLGFGVCGSAYAIVIGGILLFFIIVSMMRRP